MANWKERRLRNLQPSQQGSGAPPQCLVEHPPTIREGMELTPLGYEVFQHMELTTLSKLHPKSTLAPWKTHCWEQRKENSKKLQLKSLHQTSFQISTKQEFQASHPMNNHSLLPPLNSLKLGTHN